ncbi:sensor histidine kinase [Hyalangium versicolor]|uniref:sensor histidine kinase n=1 Tax=Hyalangium versicolor TaxID=2861190 RepID=UPI001CCE58BD|nr:PAS domain-containing sensor histidine kinase [Hyalangium versicolor]
MAQPALPRNPIGVLPSAVPEEARPFLHALLNAPGWAVGFLDRELRLRWGNETLVGLTGQPMPIQLGKTVTELWPGLAAGLSPLCGRALQGEPIHGATVTTEPDMTADGRRIHLRISLLPATSGGAMTGIALLLQDDTERVEREEGLREAETRLKTLVDLSCDGYLIHDGETVLEASRGSASLLGCLPEELVGQPLFRFLAPESRQAAKDAYRAQQEMPYELTALRYGELRVPIQVLAREVTYRGRQVSLAALWDITGKKAAEEAATRAEYLREQLLGVVGHDLRTPLNTVMLGLSALQHEGKLEERQTRQLTIMSNAARRMERMIYELLDFTRARLAGGIPVNPTPMSLGPVVDRVVEEYRLAHPEYPILPVAEGDLDGHWDESRLAQLLDNLLQNALRHSMSNTSIGLSVKGEPSGVTLIVLNKGPLLLPEEREAIFEPFRRGKRPAGEGLGLGLFIAKQIAEAHGGRISVESAIERGTSFKVWLPRRHSR